MPGTTALLRSPCLTRYELDDLTLGLLWACASLDAGLQADDQELTVALGELAPYENLPSSAVSREAASDLGMTSQMWLGSDFCARHILRNLEPLAATPSVLDPMPLSLNPIAKLIMLRV